MVGGCSAFFSPFLESLVPAKVAWWTRGLLGELFLDLLILLV